MVRTSPIQNNFNGGVISPLLANRNDLVAYQKGLASSKNFISRTLGAITRRSGTKFVKEIKSSANKTHLVPFIFDNDDAYVLEFGNNYIRFFKNRTPVLSGGVPYEIASPYGVADLFDANDLFLISFCQSNDVIYMAHKDYAPRKLTRTSDTSWAISTVTTKFGPFDDLNISNTTVYASAVSGSVTLTASTGIFQPGDVGTQFYIEANPDTTDMVWEVATNYSQNDIVKSGGRYYKAISLTDGTSFASPSASGSVIPSHLEGVVSDGKIDWQYLHSGYGYVTITAYSSSTNVTATVNSRLPENAVGSGNATKKWAFGAWNSVFGYPEYVTFFNERLTFAGNSNVWFSVVGDYENFALKDGPDLAPDMAIKLPILSNQYNGIRWLYPLDDLIVGTQGSIHKVGPLTTQQVFSSTNIKSKPINGRGCLAIPPIQIETALLFVQRSSTNLLSLSYNPDLDTQITPDISILAEHLLKAGICQMVYQQRPDNILWCLLCDGTLLALTLNDAQEVQGWHPHDIAGNGFVESLAVIPSPDGKYDDLWLIVRRTINGSTKRYIEYMEQYFDYGKDVKDSYFVDCGVVYDGVATTTITGLDHLEGETVQILGDGAVQPDKVVSGGQITLSYSASKVAVGYSFISELKTLNYQTGGTRGSVVGKTKRIDSMTIQFYETVGAKAGFADNLEVITFRKSSDLQNQAVPLFTGSKKLTKNSGYSENATVTIRQDQPLPMTILSIVPDMGAYED